MLGVENMIKRNSSIDLSFTSESSSMTLDDLLSTLPKDEQINAGNESEDLGQKELEVPEEESTNQTIEQVENQKVPEQKELTTEKFKPLTLPEGSDDDLGDLDDDEEYEEEEPEPEPIPEIHTITQLSKNLRNGGMKFSVFNIKGTLIRYLEMFGERKVARHVLDQDSHAFYEIHAGYVPGGAMFRLLTKLGFTPLHPTEVDDDYPKDMSYDLDMSNGHLFINVFGGLQQHAPTEETVIRNLYASERMRYAKTTGSSTSLSGEIEDAQEKVSKNLMLAAMQSFAVGKQPIAWEFFTEAMSSQGIDALMASLSETKGFNEDLEYDVSEVVPQKVFDEKFEPVADSLVAGEDEDEPVEDELEPIVDEFYKTQQTAEYLDAILAGDISDLSPEFGNTIYDRAPRYVETSDIVTHKVLQEDKINDSERAEAMHDSMELFSPK